MCVNPVSLAKLLRAHQMNVMMGPLIGTCRWHLGGQEREVGLFESYKLIFVFLYYILCFHPQSPLILLCLCDQLCLPLCCLSFLPWVPMLTTS